MSQSAAPPPSSSPGVEPPGPVALTHRFVADAGTASRLARALARGTMRSRRMLVFWGVVVLVAVGSYALDIGLGVAITI